jgi:hypothetical protein
LHAHMLCFFLVVVVLLHAFFLMIALLVVILLRACLLSHDFSSRCHSSSCMPSFPFWSAANSHEGRSSAIQRHNLPQVTECKPH